MSDDVLSRESQRNQILFELEVRMVNLELVRDFGNLFLATKIYCRFLLAETRPDLFKQYSSRLDALNTSVFFVKKSVDPVVRFNSERTYAETASVLIAIIDDLHMEKGKLAIRSASDVLGGAS